jgi:hypothetical protein
LAEGEQNTPEEQNTINEVERLYEVVELREINSKTYRLTDDTYEYVGFAEDIHYLDQDGNLKEIDNAITDNPTKEGYTFSNTENSWYAYFADSLCEKNAVVLEKDNSKITFSMVGTQIKSDVAKSNTLDKSESQFDDMLVNDNRSVIYKEVLKNVDVAYTVRTNGLKEDIILRSASTPNVFEFDVFVEGLTILEKEDTIFFINGEGQDVFMLAPMYMEDANGICSDNVKYTIKENQGIYRVSIYPDKDFINADDTQFPVIIDPSIVLAGSSNTFDSCVDQQYPNSNYYLSQNLWTGGLYNTNAMRTFIKFTLPTNIPSANITSAYLKIKRNAYPTPTIKAYRVTSGWTSSTIKWTNQPGYTTTYGSTTASYEYDNWYSMYATQIVKNWIGGVYSNYGFVLKEPSESNSTQKTRFYSSDAPSPNKPELHIIYVDYPPAPPAQPSDSDFVSLYGGDAGRDYWLLGLFSAPKEQDAIDFGNIMTNHYNFTQRRYSNQAQHSYINGYNGSNQADILYWSGHALPDGRMSYYSGSTYVSYIDGFVGHEEVGSTIGNWNSVGYYSNSQWNADLDWAIIAACDQFTNSDTREAWGRTLLGSYNRAHSVWGYAQVAPKGPIDSCVLDYWTYYLQLGFSIKDAWFSANYDNDIDLPAGITHYDNRNDGMYPYGSVSASTSPQSYPNLYYYVAGSGSQISVQTSLIEGSSNYDNATFSTTVYVEDKIINVNLPIEKYNRTFEDVELYTLSEADKNIEEVVAEVLDSTKITKTESSSTNLDIISYSDGTNTVMYDTGDFGIRVVMDGKYVSSDKISLSAQEAWESTKQFIIEKKLLTEKELLELAVEIIPITAQKIDVNSEDTNNDSGPAFTTDYLIKMRRQIDGIPVSITASGVKATISDEGVYWLSKEWNEMIPTGKMVEILSVDEILTSMQTELVNMRDDLENITITDISLIYFPSTTSENCTELIPAWECTYANGTLIFDACSGKLIGQ